MFLCIHYGELICSPIIYRRYMLLDTATTHEYDFVDKYCTCSPVLSVLLVTWNVSHEKKKELMIHHRHWQAVADVRSIAELESLILSEHSTDQISSAANCEEWIPALVFGEISSPIRSQSLKF